MPLMGTRGGGSVRGFGRFGKNLLLIFVDTFSRSTSGSLGVSSDGKGVWKDVRGTWQANGSSAASQTGASNNNIAVVDMDSSKISNLQVDTGTSGGVGLSFWVTDANSWWGIYPNYRTTTSSQTIQTCTGPGLSGTSPYPGSGCAGTCVNVALLAQCTFGQQWVGYEPSNNGCVPSQDYGGPCQYGYWGYYCVGGQCTTNATIANSTQTTTTYHSEIKIDNAGGTQHTNTYSSGGGFSKTQSIGVSTSGDTISYSAYNSTGKGGSVIASSSITPSSPTKGVGAGIFQASSANDQGSTVDNFGVEVTP